MYRTIRKLTACIMLLAFMLAGATAAAAAEDEVSEAAFSVLLPYPISWLEERIEDYSRETGTEINVIQMYSQEQVYSGEGIIENYMEQLNGIVASEDCPDVFFFGSVPAHAFVEKSRLADLSGLIPEFADCYTSGYFMLEDGLYSVPLTLDKDVMLTNTELYSGEIPETREEFAEVCRSLTPPEGVYVTSESTAAAGDKKWIAREFQYEAYGYIDMNTLSVNFGNDDFAELMENYAEYYKSMSGVSTDGKGINSQNMYDGKLIFGRSKLSSAISRCTGEENIVISDVPYFDEAAAGYFCISGGLAVTKDADIGTAVGLLRYLLSEDVQTKFIGSGMCAVNKAAMERRLSSLSAENAAFVADALSSLTLPTIYDQDMKEGTAYTDAIFGDIANAYSSYLYYSTDAKDTGYNMQATLNNRIKQYMPEEQSTVAAVVTVLLTVALVVVIGFIAAIIVRTGMVIVERRRELRRISRGKYGRELDTIYGKDRESVIVALLSLLFVGILIGLLTQVGKMYSDVPLRVRKLLIWIFICGGLSVMALAVSSAMLSRIHLCERAVIVVNGGRIRAIHADEIEHIYTEVGTKYMIALSYGKPAQLRSSMYHDLKEKLDAYSRDVLAEIQKENG